jgi:site-specific recombinase XerD
VQEICDLTVKSIAFGRIPVVTIVGKGKKIRQVPLWSETAKRLYEFLEAINFL